MIKLQSSINQVQGTVSVLLAKMINPSVVISSSFGVPVSSQQSTPHRNQPSTPSSLVAQLTPVHHTPNHQEQTSMTGRNPSTTSSSHSLPITPMAMANPTDTSLYQGQSIIPNQTGTCHTTSSQMLSNQTDMSLTDENLSSSVEETPNEVLTGENLPMSVEETPYQYQQSMQDQEIASEYNQALTPPGEGIN